MIDVLVIGGGVGGLAAAYHARKRGLSVILVEAGDRLGHGRHQRGLHFDAACVGSLHTEHLSDCSGRLGPSGTEAAGGDVDELQHVAIGLCEGGGEVVGRELLGVDQELADAHAVGAVASGRGRASKHV